MSSKANKSSRGGFRITGAYLTQTARTLMVEQGWRKGYELLMEGLEGMEAQTALAVLSGKKRLEGVNELEVVDDDCEQKISAVLAPLFQGCFEYRGVVFRAYGVVTRFSMDDYRFSLRVAEEGFAPKNTFWRAAMTDLSVERVHWTDNRSQGSEYRPLMYLEDANSDVLVYIEGHAGRMGVVCERCLVDVPLWMTLPKRKEDVQAVLQAEWAGGRLRDLTPVDSSMPDQVPCERGGEHVLSAQEQREQTLIAEQVLDGLSLKGFSEPKQEDEGSLEGDVPSATVREERYRERVVAFTEADTEFGWRLLESNVGGKVVRLRVPARAFLCAALRRGGAYDRMPKYSPVCPQGLKMARDCAYHSDAWLGAGMRLEDAYDFDMPEQRLFTESLHTLQRELLRYPFDVLCRGATPYVVGEVCLDPQKVVKGSILVVETASPEYADAALRCQGVIVATGSKLAHMVVVSREEGVPVVRVLEGIGQFEEGMRVSIDFTEGVIRRGI